MPPISLFLNDSTLLRLMRERWACRWWSRNKIQAFNNLLAQAGVTDAEVSYIGDDLNDIPLLLQSGLGVAVADAAFETRQRAHYVTKAPGGCGAVREVIELIFKSQSRWDELISGYLSAR